MLTLKTPSEIEIMAEGGRRLAEVLKDLSREVKPGVRTSYFDEKTQALIKQKGCRTAFLGYRPHGSKRAYPAAICVSVNEVVVHGLPSSRVLEKGDIVKLDLGLIYKGFYLDAAVTVGVGEIGPKAESLLRVTEKALYSGIEWAWAGNTVGDIGAAIERVVLRKGYSVAQGLTGHGIGKNLHEDPTIFNFGVRGEGEVLEVGMVIAIEPMVVSGKGATKQISDDSFVTIDGSVSAHFEHTVAITKDGPRILTRI